MIRFPFIRPSLPPVSAWAGDLEKAYEGRRFSNFGPLSRQLEACVVGVWGGPDSACLATSSGTAAIAAPLIAAGVTGRVVLPAFTFPATLAAVRMAGAEPIIADVDLVDWCLSAETLASALKRTSATSAIAVSPFGIRHDFRAHAEVTGSAGGIFVLDNAAGLGVSRHALERSPHCFEACSLHATKPFGVGEGGIIFAHRSQEDGLRRALNFGLAPGNPADLQGWGINGKLSEVHAAIGLAVARGFAAQVEQRRTLASRYAAVVSVHADLAACAEVDASVWQCFPILFPDPESAERFIDATAERGMHVRRYYSPSLSILDDVDRLGPCPVAERLAARMCCLPVYSDATEGEVNEMVAIFEASLAAARAHLRAAVR